MISGVTATLALLWSFALLLQYVRQNHPASRHGHVTKFHDYAALQLVFGCSTYLVAAVFFLRDTGPWPFSILLVLFLAHVITLLYGQPHRHSVSKLAAAIDCFLGLDALYRICGSTVCAWIVLGGIFMLILALSVRASSTTTSNSST